MNRPLFPLMMLFVLAASPRLSPAQTWDFGDTEFSRLAGFSQTLLVDGSDLLATRTGESALFPSPASQKGSLYVFRKLDDTWTHVHGITPERVRIGDQFGHAMALSGNVLVVSAPGADKGCGRVFVFERDKARATWAHQDTVEPIDCEQDQRFGWSVDVDGQSLFVGAPGAAGGAGVVYRYDRDDLNAWQSFQAYTGEESNSGYGEHVLALDSHLFVSAPREGSGEGTVYLYRAGSTTPTRIPNPDAEATYFGQHVAADGRYVLIGAPGVDNSGYSPSRPGAVFVYHRADTSWTPSQKITLPRNENLPASAAHGFGSAVALNGQEAWIGAPLGGAGAGAVHIYSRSSNRWSNTQTITVRPLASGARFGASLAVQGALGVAGIIRADFGEGRAVVFERAGEKWTESDHIADPGPDLAPLLGEEVRCENGKARQFDCDRVDLLSFLPVKDVGGARGVIVNDIWGWTDPETSREYAIVGRSDGTSIVDVTSPSYPVFVADLPATEGSTPNAWRDVKVYNNHVFIVADNVGKHGMQVYDLTQLRDITDPPMLVEPTTIYDPIYSAHNIIINEDTGFAYIVAASGGGETCGRGYHMVDIRDPKNPTFAGCFSDPSSGAGGDHIHDAQCVLYDGPDEDYRGHEICFGANASVFSIADVSDKSAPSTIAALEYPKVAYVHQGWLSEDNRHFYINDEGDEIGGLVASTRTLIWDVSDLDDPIFLKAHLGTTSASDHNLYIKGDFMYQSNYVSGLQILDISDPLHPIQVGHFDTVPQGMNAPGFAGSWSNYPYFESGTILVSSINEGLFILRKSEEALP